MAYTSLAECIADLERTRQIVRIDDDLDPRLEIPAVHRRVCRAGGPALLFTHVKGCAFPVASNLFGTLDRARFLFHDTLDDVRKLIALKIYPTELLKHPWQHRGVPRVLWNLRPKMLSAVPSEFQTTTISQLPQIVCWPRDGGPFVTLPQVYTEDADRPGWRHSNLGMYRIQLAGNEYVQDREVGLHYQIHRGIGVHHAKAIRKGLPFRVTIAVGGPPALAVAAVMPLPEGMPELAFAGALGGWRVRLAPGPHGLPLMADADFNICGTVIPDTLKPEGPFGDHLGYYSLAHLFPVLRVDAVFHRPGAIWPFTVVGRPPQEDTIFGKLIHELTGPVLPTLIPGLHAVHAVDAAGVHPLLLAIGSERYFPFSESRKPMELLTTANALLGQGQLSLAKYLFIIAKEDAPALDIHDIPSFFRHVLERVDWTRDLHFQTCTTIDTLDYSGTALNEGSKLVIAAAGPKRRELPTEVPNDLQFPPGYSDPKVCTPGILAVRGPAFAPGSAERFCRDLSPNAAINRFPLVLMVDDSDFCSRHLNNWLWVAFTRSNPAADVHGIGASITEKHWGCTGSLVIDARNKPHLAPPIEDDPQVEKRIELLAVRGGPLHGIL
jgi:4-hydroxy-3-polyprenylbenzoate decarboxylase